MKLAIASDDGKIISSHFGRTRGFVIFEIEGKEMKKQLIVRSFYRKIGNEQINRVFETVKPRLERIGEFDYDSLSELVKGLPKFSLARTFAPSFLRLP